VEPFTQSAERAAQYDPERTRRAAGDFADLLVVEPIDQPKGDDQLVLRLQSCDRAADFVTQVSDKSLAFGIIPVAVAWFDGHTNELSAMATIVVDHKIVGDREQPGEKRSARERPVAVDRLPRAEKGLRGDVLGQVGIAQSGTDVRVNSIDVRFIETREGGGIGLVRRWRSGVSGGIEPDAGRQGCSETHPLVLDTTSGPTRSTVTTSAALVVLSIARGRRRQQDISLPPVTHEE
jgi:hypothetical protein